jgi:predicted ribosome quality control (RQC) complex YloA/Tae2 family protein
LGAQLVPPPRIVDLWKSGATGSTILLESEEGARFELVIDVDPSRATLHTRPVSHAREDHSQQFASRIAGGYLMAVRRRASSVADPGATLDEDRVARLAVRKPAEVDPGARDWTLVIEWTGRSGNVRLVDREGVVQEALRALGAQAGDRYARPLPDPRPALSETTPDELANRMSASTPRAWCKNLARFRGVSPVMAFDAIWTSMDLPRDPAQVSAIDPIERLIDHASRPEFDLLQLAKTVYRRLLAVEEERTRNLDRASEDLGRDVQDPDGNARDFARRERELSSTQDLSRATQDLSSAIQDPGRAFRLQLYRTPPALRSILPAAIVSERVLESLSPYRVENAPADPMAILATAYSIQVEAHREETRRAHYERRFRSEMQRLQRMRKKVAAEAGAAEDESRLRLYGEAILANLRLIKKGDTLLVCDDWTHGPDGSKLEIPLDPARPATHSADQYFKRARRAAKSRPIREKRIAKLDEAMAKLSMLESRMRDRPSLPDATFIESGLRDALRSFYKEPTSPDPGLRMAAADSRGRLGVESGGSGRSRGAGLGPPKSSAAKAGAIDRSRSGTGSDGDGR